MSHSVVRGKPFASQFYLDGILDGVLRSGVSKSKGRDEVNLPQIIYYCLRKNPTDLFMINAATGKKITNFEILQKAVFIARALISKGARGKQVMLMMKNHETMAAVYFAVMFAGTEPFMMIPDSTVYEIKHFLKIIEPCMVFCDEEYFGDVNTALQDTPITSEVILFDWDELHTEMNGFSFDADDFEIPDVDGDATVMILPTSGSTGLPKTVIITHRGQINRLPLVWCLHTQFPTPIELCAIVSTSQRISFMRTLLSCVVYSVPVVMSRRIYSEDWVKHILVTYRPNWIAIVPAFAKTLLPTLTDDHLSSLKTLILLGAPSSIDILTAVKEKMHPSATLINSFGITEAYGTITISVPGAPLDCLGQVFNTLDYKLVDDDGKTVGPGQSGELYIKAVKSTIKGYFKNQKANDQVFTNDGWYKTGDVFYIDAKERLFYVERKNLCFKFMLANVSPEEVEMFINSVPGVKESVVCATERGPAAMVVVHSTSVTRDQIHNTVNQSLSVSKRLHGGIAFIPSLPHTHSGKLHRPACKTLIQDLLAAGECF